MKQLLLVALIAVTLVSCSKSPEQKAKDLIKEEMKKSMNDFSSYEPVEYGKLDSVRTTFFSAEETMIDYWINKSKEDLQKMNDYIDFKIGDKDDFNFYKEQDLKDIHMADSLNKKVEKEKAAFKPEFKGWVMAHKFRGKNKLGALVLNSNIYEFDKEVTKIVEVTNLGKE